ncbi:serine carboxypeptidase-like 40 [Salvia miltiorrhiza]|uniref:serine carboxypeptidase-like 40 n=1 Tax=Salvia miltiorrhiza TaxID=226208 RepID=UPI0025AC85BB|nr:serine carboxypeptidase-like 40 [Salvia miltiorrhiza]
MRQKIALMVLMFTFMPSCFNTAENINGKKQSEVLYHFYMSKLMKNSKIDTRHFNATSIDFGEEEIYPQKGVKENDRIQRLPGQPQVKFTQYGGYVNVNRRAGRALYYYFVEAHHSHKSLPLLLWLNGGPGCSSLGYGAMEEVGPFRVHTDGKTLYHNNFSWNHAANMVFLESPAGVGFSYSKTWADLMRNGDRNTAIDNYSFLVNWLERFGEYKDRDLYIAGESYGGHYIPQLARTILHHNQKANKTIINLKGLIIGNPTLNDETDAKGMYEYYESHGLISRQTLNRVLRHCDFRDNSRGLSTQCLLGILESERDTAALDIYNIYAPTCSTTSPTNQAINIDPCIDQYVHRYLNRPEVQEALHANITNIPYDWQACSEVIKWRDSPSTIIPLLKDFIASGLRVWIYSGDVDGRVPVTSTKLSIQLMKLNPTTPWLPWYLHDQVGGFTQTYEGNLTFATVRGAGHEVPSYQPARALFLIKHFLEGKDLPTSTNFTLFSSSHT